MREMTDADAKTKLKLGDDHYLAYVGPPEQYDFMGATQFRLLCALGLRAEHTLLDFGCGSLRGGRLFIPYLDPDRYFGLEPNKWLVDEGIANHVGRDLVDRKGARFLYNDDFRVGEFDTRFDFILAQSIFSHSGTDIVEQTLREFADHLKEDGLIAATFIESEWGASNPTEKGWFYPGSVRYRPSMIRGMAASAGLHVARLHWYHPRQRWYVFSRSQQLLPSFPARLMLTGATLSYPGLRASYHPPTRSWQELRRLTKPTVRRVRRHCSTVVRGWARR